MADEFEDFEKTGSGASHTFPQQAGTIRKGGYVMLKSRPCKVVETSTSKTGKHGHAKVHITGLDIFTNRKYEDICPTSHSMDVPNVTRYEMQLISIDEDGFLSLMGEDGSMKSDLRVPQDEVGDQIRKFAGNEDQGVIMVSILSSCGEEKVVAVKTSQ